ncbi:MAG: prepilin-type N-terminal cleavage/methylation domain-containing protein [Planctomycetota bacterium]|jgi:prepilin-type N-terminal cleavage/methylation domain-containing protein
MRPTRHPSGFTLVELLVVVLILVVLLVVAVPSIARTRTSAGIQQSIANLTMMSLAHVLYAADWEGRQVTWTRDDLGVYNGDVQAYPNHPPIEAGLGPNSSGLWVMWSYRPDTSQRVMLQPINFFGGPAGSSYVYWGHFRIPNSRPFHDYLSGRHHDPVYFAPNDTIVVDPLLPCLDEPPEFVGYPAACNPGWSSYCFSAAAMFHPDVWRSNAAGGWQAPWGLDHGYESPGLFQATYPDLKTHMLEHSWLQNSPGDCNPAFLGCEPYYFNHALASAPVTLFYDGSVRLLPNTEVQAADLQILDQTDGVDGLWHRGTSFGDDGYLNGDGYDSVELSHHVLTTDGILGRDTLGGAAPPAFAAPPEAPRRARIRQALAWGPKTNPARAPFTPEDEP